MRYLVSWSGGLDSSYLIQKLLEDGHGVCAFYTEIKNNKYKTIRERKAIKSMISYFKPYNFEYLGSVNIEIDVPVGGIFYLSQPSMFILGALYSAKNNYDRFAMGYVMNDDAISYLSEIKNIWNSYKGIVSYLPEIEFPLMKTSKISILNKIQPEIEKNFTYCESVEAADKCGKCGPCIRYKEIEKLSKIRRV